jgi:hypothetical protein
MNIESARMDSETSDIGDPLQANWIPLSLIAVGIAWLVANNTSPRKFTDDRRVQTSGYKIDELPEQLSAGGDTPETAGTAGQILGPDAQPLTGTTSEQGNGWVHQAAGAARGAFGSVRGAGSAMLERAGSAGALANRASSQVTEKLTADPWLLGVVGFVGGALLAAMFPPTTIERAYFGEACNGLRNKANELGHEAAERVRELADPATRTTTH